MMNIYLAGAIDAHGTREDAHTWRAEAKVKLKALGFNVLCPLCDNENASGDSTAKIVEGDLDLVELSQFLLVNGELLSEGTAMEVYAAATSVKNGYPATLVVTYGLPATGRTFMRYHSDFLTQTLDEAIAVIEGVAVGIVEQYGTIAS